MHVTVCSLSFKAPEHTAVILSAEVSVQIRSDGHTSFSCVSIKAGVTADWELSSSDSPFHASSNEGLTATAFL